MLVHYRKGIGLPALTINWALWAGGMVSVKDQRQLEQLGLRAMVPDEAFRILDALIGGASNQVTIADVDWSMFKSVFETKGPHPLFKQIAVQITSTKASFILDELKSLPGRERYNRLKSHVHELVRKVLGYPTTQALDDHTGLFDLGIDSLTGVELVGQLQTSLGCSLPSTLIFKYPTIGNLVDFLNTEVLPPDAGKAEEKESSPASSFDELSRDELAQQLVRKLHAMKNN